MAWWNPFSDSKSREIEVKATIGDAGDPIRQFLLYGARSNAENPGSALDLYEKSTAIAIPVNKIAEKFADLTPIIMVGDEKISEHPLLDLLNRPNDDFDQELFMLNMAINYLVTGEVFFVELGTSGKPPLQIYPMTPRNVQHSDSGGFITSFEITGDHFGGVYMRDDSQFWSREGLRSLVQIRNFSLKDNSMYRGRSKLISASDTARQQILGTEHNLSILEKGGRLSLLFAFDTDMDDDDFKLTQERVAAQFGGAEKAGQIGVTAGGSVDIKNLSQTNQDMDWAGAQNLSARILALTYNLPLPLLSLEAATMNNYQSALEALYDDAVTPLSKVIYGGIERSLGQRFKLPDNARLTYDEEKIPALVRRRNEQVKMRADLGIESDNELRNMIGRENYQGGDQIYKASNLLPVGTDLFDDDGESIVGDDEI